MVLLFHFSFLLVLVILGLLSLFSLDEFIYFLDLFIVIYLFQFISPFLSPPIMHISSLFFIFFSFFLFHHFFNISLFCQIIMQPVVLWFCLLSWNLQLLHSPSNVGDCFSLSYVWGYLFPILVGELGKLLSFAYEQVTGWPAGARSSVNSLTTLKVWRKSHPQRMKYQMNRSRVPFKDAPVLSCMNYFHQKMFFSAAWRFAFVLCGLILPNNVMECYSKYIRVTLPTNKCADVSISSGQDSIHFLDFLTADCLVFMWCSQVNVLHDTLRFQLT